MKLNIRSRLYFGSIAAIFLVILVGILSYVTFKHQNEQAALVKHTYVVINNLRSVQGTLVDMETGRRGFRGTNDKTYLEPYNQGLVAINPLLSQLTQVITDNPVQVQNLGVLQASIANLLGYWRELGFNSASYTAAHIDSITLQEKKLMDNIRLQLNKMMHVEQTLLSNRETKNTRAINQATYQLLTAIILILLIVSFLIYQTLREFKNKTKAELRLQKKHSELYGINQENLRKNWLLEGLAVINDCLQTIKNTDKGSKEVLHTLLRYLEMPAGAYYTFDVTKQQLTLIATVALPVSVRQHYNLGEGLPGNAATISTPSVVKNIPANYVLIEGAFMQVKPVSVCYVPLFIDKHLIGLLELLSLTDVKKTQVELLKLVSDNIAIALQSSKANEEVLQLLEQVQHQKVSLENQQEELRQTNEELTMQAEVLHASQEEMKVQEEELRQMNAELEERNEAVEAARQGMMMKAKELEDATRFKSEFLANMSHELRTPLNSILILARLLADNNSSNLTDKQVAHAKIIHKSGTDLLRLINDILDLSKIEAGKTDLHYEEVSVKSFVSDVEQLFTIVAQEKDIDFVIVVDTNLPERIETDVQKMGQILKNLLANAFKFTQHKGKITLQASTAQHNSLAAICFTVKDNGIGIPEKNQQLIFQAFAQGDGATNRKFGGTGLGLSIVTQLVNLLHGTIQLESKEGEGSIFKVIFPIRQTGIQHLAPLLQKDANPYPDQATLPDDRHTLKPADKVMLIIEDDIHFATIMRDYAIDRGYKVVVAINGEEGLHCARKYKPAAIILDMGLPIINGSELLAVFKNDTNLRHIPIHIISAADESKPTAAGVLAYLKKPVEKTDIEKAFTLIEEYLEASVKKVLLLSGKNLKDDLLTELIHERKFDVTADQVNSVEDALVNIRTKNYDCLIADISGDVKAGAANLKHLTEGLLPRQIPTIIYIDEDITLAAEVELKRISNVVIRKSAASNNRLMDELELFLYKIEGHTNTSFVKHIPAVNDSGLSGKKVLVVDDDMRNVFALSAALEAEQMLVLAANDGKEAIEMIKANHSIDIVLMDIMMPEMDGYEAMQHIRDDLKIVKLPIIALTAKAMAGDREKCIAAGASDYITKPVDTQKLVSLIRVWLA